MIAKRWLVSLLCCCMVVTSCTTLRDIPLPVDGPAASAAGLRSGDKVIVTLHDGTSHELKVTRVEPDAISGTARHGGATERYAYTDMQILEVRRASWGRTTGAVFVATVAVGVALFYVLMAAYADSAD